MNFQLDIFKTNDPVTLFVPETEFVLPVHSKSIQIPWTGKQSIEPIIFIQFLKLISALVFSPESLLPWKKCTSLNEEKYSTKVFIRYKDKARKTAREERTMEPVVQPDHCKD